MVTIKNVDTMKDVDDSGNGLTKTMLVVDFRDASVQIYQAYDDNTPEFIWNGLGFSVELNDRGLYESAIENYLKGLEGQERLSEIIDQYRVNVGLARELFLEIAKHIETILGGTRAIFIKHYLANVPDQELFATMKDGNSLDDIAFNIEANVDGYYIVDDVNEYLEKRYEQYKNTSN